MSEHADPARALPPDGVGAERPDRDSLTQRETIMLYGQSAGRCAKCRALVVRHSDEGLTYGIGERAHIAARSDDGPRADLSLTPRQRGDLLNHLLLCASCHKEIDENVADWPIEALHDMRVEHLAWIAERLSGAEGPDPVRLVYTRSVEAAVELIHLDAWAAWTERMLRPALSWQDWQVDRAVEFNYRIAMTDWPGELPELEVSIGRLAHLVSRAAESFSDRATVREGQDLHVYKDFKRIYPNPNIQAEERAYEAWAARYEGLLVEATKAASWVRESWRAAGNPAFMPGDRVHLVLYPDEDGYQHAQPFEYTAQERDALLAAGPADVADVPCQPVVAADPLDAIRLVLREVLREELGRTPSRELIDHLAEGLQGAEGPFRVGDLLADAPGSRPTSDEIKAISYELHRHDVLSRNPHGRGYVRGPALGW